MALGCPIPSCLASGGKMIKVKDIHAGGGKNLKMHVPRNWYVMPQGTQYAAAAFVSTRFRDQILEAWMIGERSILDDFLAKNDLVQWLGCWSLQPLAIIMFLDESWRHSNGFGIIAADGHLGFDFQVHDCM